jgi:uncharacterized membrane protein YGL010W
MQNPRLSQFFEEYEAYHAHPTNKLCHFIGIPMIVVSSIGLLSRVHLVLAGAVALGILLFDVRLSLRLTLPYAAFMGASFLVAPFLSTPLLWGLFLAGWVLQFVGHFAFEKKSPAFFKNVQQLLVAPLWIIEELRGTRSTLATTPGSARLEE